MRISEIFFSIQGEGRWTGIPAVFVRFAGCPLRCRWCDTPYSLDPAGGQPMTLEAVCEAVTVQAGTHCRHVVLTGGEPLSAPELAPLSRALAEPGGRITLETAAIAPPPVGLHCDLASLSPKFAHTATGPPPPSGCPASPVPQVLDAWMAQFDYQLKFVVQAEADIAEILALLGRLRLPPPPERVLLMPEGTDPETLNRHAPLALDACKRYGFRFCDRLHIRLFGHQRGV